MTANIVVYTDDPDAHWTFTINDRDSVAIDWAPLEVAADDGAYDLTASWETPASPNRTLRVDLTTLPAGHHKLYLKVPGGNDLYLGTASVYDR